MSLESIHRAIKISEHVYWVGAVDWSVRDFHGYLTSRGTTYNAFLVMADKITLIDAVKAPYRDVLLSRISSVVDPSKIDYIISNHSEMDHSGCLPEVIRACRPERVFASKMGVKALERHFHGAVQATAIDESAPLPLGNMNLRFLETRMVHWPDSMVSWLDADRVLFSQDGFGMHLATEERFIDQVDPDIVRTEAAKYYANILLPFSRFVTQVLDRIKASGLPISIIAPDHGPIFRENLDTILGWYRAWAEQKRVAKAVVTHATMWGSTSLLAQSIAEGVAAAGAKIKLLPLSACHRSDIATELLDAGGLAVGSPTINNGMFPTVADLLTYVRGLKPAGLAGFSFGSHGWSGEGAKAVQAELSAMNVDLIEESPFAVNYVPDRAALETAFGLGRSFGDMLLGRFGR